MNRLYAFYAMAATAAFALLGAAQPDGNAILGRAAADAGLTSYSVPVHFDVRMHRPIGIRSSVEGVIYFKGPATAALKITKVPGPLSGFFKSAYTLDLVPQCWPSKYVVQTVSTDPSGVYVLTAMPKNDPSVDHAVFKVTQQTYQPVGVTWSYKDGSSIALTIVNHSVQGYTLPATQTISVSMPKYALDANATYGDYAINAPVPDGVFQNP